jgi:hypothetical protein
MKISSPTSADINVTYDFLFTPSYNYPIGSQIIIEMDPGKFSQIDKSFPPAVCATSFAAKIASCLIEPNRITVTLSALYTEGVEGQITLTGVKNPTFIGTTGATDIKITAYHSGGQKIDEDYYPTVTYQAAGTSKLVTLNVSLTSYFASVASDYTFSLQNTRTVPSGGTINIAMPQNFARILKTDTQIYSLDGSFTTSKLVYNAKFLAEPMAYELLQITTSFEWPAPTQLIIQFRNLINPVQNYTTGNFRAYTQYDSSTLDQSR